MPLTIMINDGKYCIIWDDICVETSDYGEIKRINDGFLQYVPCGTMQ